MIPIFLFYPIIKLIYNKVNTVNDKIMETIITTGQATSWYHSRIVRIPHDDMPRVPGKKYVTDEELLKFFTQGVVTIQEKIDGHISGVLVSKGAYDYRWQIFEDISGKNTPHKHIIQYKYPGLKHVSLDYVMYDGIMHEFKFQSDDNTFLTYATLNLNNMPLASVEDIHDLLRFFAKLPSHYHSPKIEGLVIKNYLTQEMLKWINPEFEDKINGR